MSSWCNWPNLKIVEFHIHVGESYYCSSCTLGTVVMVTIMVLVRMVLMVRVTWRMPEKVGRVSARKRRRAIMRERNIVRLMVNSTIQAW